MAWNPVESTKAFHHLLEWRAGGDRTSLDALSDVGTLRRMLDEAELATVRAARGAGRSWAEIAVRLGVTRQSAWEKWSELDKPPVAEAVSAPKEPSARRDYGAPQLEDDLVYVIDVVGWNWDDAREALRAVSLVAVGPDLDGPPLAALGWPDGRVTAQQPAGGTVVERNSTVTLWLRREGDGGAGVREPRRPAPKPQAGRMPYYEPADETA